MSREIKIRTEIELEIIDKQGNVKEKYVFESHSWLAQFVAMLKGMMAHVADTNNSGNVNVIDYDGIARAYPLSNSPMRVSSFPINAPGNDDTYGILVGTSSTPNTPTTYRLGSKISHGTGSGQLRYLTHTVGNPTNPTGGEWIFIITRLFLNESGADVSVSEIGLVANAVDSSGTARYFCLARDVISTITVPNNQYLSVRYKPKIVVS